MTNQNIDGIRKPKNLRPIAKPAVSKPKILKVDGLVRRSAPRVEIKTAKRPVVFIRAPSAGVRGVLDKGKKFINLVKGLTPIKKVPGFISRPRPLAKVYERGFAVVKNLYSQRRVPVLAAVLALFLAFAFGGWFALNTTRSAADDLPSASATQTPAGSLVLSGIATPDPSDAEAGNALFNTPIEYLKNYFDSINQPGVINARQTQLTQFLKDMHSPLVPAAETIAEQPHWQLILAIAFAESTLGKNCNDYNCSNIGVAPNSPYWQKYDSYNAWVLDFNRLLDKKYNNWTLQQMCGVYVKPCNPNWLQATQEILDALKDRGIE